jgi:SAM-dependent methyltransferase
VAHAGTGTDKSAQRYDLLNLANERLHPSLCNPNFLVLRSRRIIFQRWIEGLAGESLSVLDVGGRYQPYRPLFGSRSVSYTACDVVRTELVDVVGSGEYLPFASQSFDVAVATQVFDCFAEPRRAAAEIYRVLKRGGVLLGSMPAVAPRFTEDEYWRFTPTGIRSLLSAFARVDVIPETSSAAGLLRTANLALDAFGRGKIARKIIALTLCPGINLLGLGLESIGSSIRDRFTPNYSVRAVK